MFNENLKPQFVSVNFCYILSDWKIVKWFSGTDVNSQWHLLFSLHSTISF